MTPEDQALLAQIMSKTGQMQGMIPVPGAAPAPLASFDDFADVRANAMLPPGVLSGPPGNEWAPPVSRSDLGVPPTPMREPMNPPRGMPPPSSVPVPPQAGPAPGGVPFSPLPRGNRLTEIPVEQQIGGSMLGKIAMPPELVGLQVGLGPGGMPMASPPPQSAVATNDAPPPPAGPASGGGGVLGGLFSGDRRDAIQDMLLGWAMGAGGTWQDSIAAGAKNMMVGKVTRAEKEEAAKSLNATQKLALSKGITEEEIAAFGKDGKGLLAYTIERSKGAAPTDDMREYEYARTQGFTGSFADWQKGDKSAETVVVGDKLVDKRTGKVIGDYSNGIDAPTTRVVKQADGSEVAVQWDPKAGKWVPLDAPVGGNAVRPSAPKLTEGQSKDVTFLTRGIEAGRTLDALDESLASYGDSALAGVPLVGNSLVSEKFQQAQQAGREFLAVILRKDTGAAITEQEMEQYGKMYLPQPGDSADTLKQKRIARQRALDGIYAGLGPAQSMFPDYGKQSDPQSDGWTTMPNGARIREVK